MTTSCTLAPGWCPTGEPPRSPTGTGAAAPQDLDIFWDDFEHQLVGAAAIGVTPLLKLDLVREYITLRDLSGNVTGAVEAVDGEVAPECPNSLGLWKVSNHQPS